MMELKRFTRKEVTLLNTKKNAAFVIDNQVYDVTKFLDDHPGGHEVLVNIAGKDATESFDDIGHSSDAKEMMKKFLVGEIVDGDKNELKKRKVIWSENKSESDADIGTLSSWKFPVVLALFMTILYSYLFG